LGSGSTHRHKAGDTDLGIDGHPAFAQARTNDVDDDSERHDDDERFDRSRRIPADAVAVTELGDTSTAAR
jgi:hypothetical protein